jgi:type II secretory pathway component GspD/PulD (secretin)
LALENQEASVIIGDRRGYQVTTTINQITTESIEFLESGVILKVTPQVDSNDMVLLDVHPEVSTGTVDSNGIPSQVTTEVTTQLLVPSGRTVFIGGLMKHTEALNRSGVPVLRRIPGIRRLFSNEELTDVNSETIVLITPYVVDNLDAQWNSKPLDKVRDADADAAAAATRLEAEKDRFGGSKTEAAAPGSGSAK